MVGAGPRMKLFGKWNVGFVEGRVKDSVQKARIMQNIVRASALLTNSLLRLLLSLIGEDKTRFAPI